MRAQPLLELNPHLSFDGCGVRAGPDPPDQVQPMVVAGVEIRIALDERLCVQGQEKIRRMVAQSVAKETRRSDSNHGKWLVIEIEDAADNGRIRPVSLPPQAMAHH